MAYDLQHKYIQVHISQTAVFQADEFELMRLPGRQALLLG